MEMSLNRDKPNGEMPNGEVPKKEKFKIRTLFIGKYPNLKRKFNANLSLQSTVLPETAVSDAMRLTFRA